MGHCIGLTLAPKGETLDRRPERTLPPHEREHRPLGSHYLDTCRLPGRIRTGPSPDRKIRKEHPEYKILLTFFSPSGYEIRKNYDQADYIFYLPIDTPGKARRFLDIAHPEIVIFVKYEFWINLLTELRRRSIRSYIVSAIFRRNSIFFRPYGGYWRMALESFDTIFVQNNDSKKLLAELGFDNVVVAGDTRFDRVAEIAAAAKKSTSSNGSKAAPVC